jgi:hypothetical protein
MNEIMRMNKLLRLAGVCGDNACVLFPSGVVTVPGKDVVHSKVLRDILIACLTCDRRYPFPVG